VSITLEEVLARSTRILTLPPLPGGGCWKATNQQALGVIGEPERPYGYVGNGATEQAAVDNLLALESADTWATERQVAA
jgi:hypothetical protein